MSAADHAVERLVVAAAPGAWRDAGFELDGDETVVRVGSVAIELAGEGAGRRIVSCMLHGIESDAFDGLPIMRAAGDGTPAVEPSAHPNGVTRIDHVVAFTPDLDRTVAAGQALGLDLRRVRDEPAPAGSPRQAFFRLDELMLEVAQAPPGSPLSGDSPARFYGLAFVVEDIDATAVSLGNLCSEPRDAIQPGRRIATVRKEAGLGLPVAFMTPRPAAS